MMELMKATDRIGQWIFSVLSVPVSFALVAHLPLSGSLDSPYDYRHPPQQNHMLNM